MEDQLINRHIAIINQAFFQLIDIFGNVLLAIATVLAALTLLGIGWLCFSESQPNLQFFAPVKLICAVTSLAMITMFSM